MLKSISKWRVRFMSSLFIIDSHAKADNKNPKIKSLISFFVEQAEHPNVHVLVARNQLKNNIIGILIAKKTQKSKIMIDYIYVNKFYRNLDIGNSLIAHLEQKCSNQGISNITVMFDYKNNAMKALTKKERGWSNGEVLNAYSFSNRTSMEPVLRTLEQSLSRRAVKCEIRSLLEYNLEDFIKETQMNDLPEWARLNNYSLEFVSKELSRVFLHNDQLVGWLITRVDPRGALYYRTLWVNDAYRRTGIAIKALTQVVRQAHFASNIKSNSSSNQLGHPYHSGLFIFNSKNQLMTKFVNKRLLQAISQKTKLLCREKGIA